MAGATFVKLSTDEALSRFSHLRVGDGEIKIWQKDGTPLKCRLLSFHHDDRDKIILTIKNDELNQSWIGKNVYFQFVVREVNFFGQLKFEASSTGAYKALVEGDVFKHEKRRSERLLAFPHHKIYLYFGLESKLNQHNNVSFLHRADQKEVKIFQKFTQEKAFNDMDKGVLTGFRVIDISPTGASFLANELERGYFVENQKDYQIIVEFNGSVIKTLEGTIVYDISFVNPRARNVPMFKMGVSFKEVHPILSRLVEEQLGGPEPDVDINNEFETFIK